MAGGPDDDPLLKAARAARDEARRARAAGDAKAEADDSSFGQAAEEAREAVETAKRSYRFFRNAAATVAAIYDDYLKPFVGFAAPPFRWFGRRYMRVFNRVAYKKDASGARTVFSRNRAAATVVTTAVAALITVYYWFFVPTLWGVVLDTAYYFTERKMAIYLHSPERIDSGEYEVSGCLRYPCDDEDTYYFHIIDNVWMDVEYLFTRGYFHYPENTAGRLTGEANKCEARFAGSTARWGQRNLGLSTKILDLTCTPISADAVPLKPEQ